MPYVLSHAKYVQTIHLRALCIMHGFMRLGMLFCNFIQDPQFFELLSTFWRFERG